MNRAWGVVLIALTVGVVVSAVEVVHTKYLTRQHFTHLQTLRVERDAIAVEWNRLRLEEAALSTYARVERKAREELGMFSPRFGDVLILRDIHP